MEYSYLSVIITNYNYNQYLQEAIDSCKGADEIIVVDDASDEIPKVTGCKMLVNFNNEGLSASRNHGIALAIGDRIICLDADDRLDPEYIKLCKENKTNDIIYGNYTEFGDTERKVITPEFDPDVILDHNFIPCVVSYPRRVCEYIQYDETMKNGYEDWDFLVQLWKAGFSIRKYDVNMFYYRQHKDSMVNKTKKHHEELKKYILQKYDTKRNKRQHNKTGRRNK